MRQTHQITRQHDAPAIQRVTAWHGAPAPCRLIQATGHRIPKAVMSGTLAHSATRQAVAGVPGMTALLLVARPGRATINRLFQAIEMLVFDVIFVHEHISPKPQVVRPIHCADTGR